LKNCLLQNTSQIPNAIPEPEMVLTAMPDAELLEEEEEIVYVPQSDYKQYEDKNCGPPGSSIKCINVVWIHKLHLPSIIVIQLWWIFIDYWHGDSLQTPKEFGNEDRQLAGLGLKHFRVRNVR
jgi:hypothetical protein